jgi:hypothetical protein
METRGYAMDIYESHPTQKEIVGTAWGAYNAVTYTIDHRRNGVRAAQASVLGGNVQPKLRAWKQVMSLPQIG